MKTSGLTQVEWCKSRGINPKSMMTMKSRIEKEGKRTPGKAKNPQKSAAGTSKFVQLPEAPQDKARANTKPAVTITIKEGIIEVGIHP